MRALLRSGVACILYAVYLPFHRQSWCVSLTLDACNLVSTIDSKLHNITIKSALSRLLLLGFLRDSDHIVTICILHCVLLDNTLTCRTLDLSQNNLIGNLYDIRFFEELQHMRYAAVKLPSVRASSCRILSLDV